MPEVEAGKTMNKSNNALEANALTNTHQSDGANKASGHFISIADERFYVINDVDQMAPFFISVISNSDHWLFVSSTGGLSAGRVSPETALFPYVTVDKIHESNLHTGSKTLLRGKLNGQNFHWEPFNREHDSHFKTSRNLYKNLLGNKLCFEEINHDLQLRFRYTWLTSDKYGFVRQCELHNLSNQTAVVEMVDGLQNILPAGTPRFTQTNSSNLVDAYKWSEVDRETGLAFFTLFSGITDRAEPSESLKANTVFCLGLEQHKVLLSENQLADFRADKELQGEAHQRGIRGAYLVNCTLELAPATSRHWQLVANLEQSQTQSVALRQQLFNITELQTKISDSVAKGSDELARIMASGDGFQMTEEEPVAVHHYANVLFNILRGGAFDNQYLIATRDFSATVNLFNHDVYDRHQQWLQELPAQQDFTVLLAAIKELKDPQLERLCYEYLPISFGRRHGDPSRPWNQFAIKLVDENDNRLLTYQGNWRDIFQNWEALTFSYPEFIENIIAKFVNASTIDGYNPYRVTKEGIDWEVEEPDDPWSYIGYWGDHQIIYLQKMLELSKQFHPQQLAQLLYRPIYSYANVPYRIKPFAALLENAKSTVVYDDALAGRIEQRVNSLGADGKLLLDAEGNVYQVNLIEKLLVTLLSKLGNLVIGGGIWLNTQRPEWNDANNALVGQGLSMVTLYYMRRYISFLQQLLASQSTEVELSEEVALWLSETSKALTDICTLIAAGPLTGEQRFLSLQQLGQAASRYREAVYQQEGFSSKVVKPVADIKFMLADALAAVDHTIACNQRDDALFNAYNLLNLQPQSLSIDSLYPMLEGQVAALSAGSLKPKQVVEVVESLFASDVYRSDQDTFMLYPDRKLPSFLQKNQVPSEEVAASSLLQQMLIAKDERIISLDVDGVYRFNAELTNCNDLTAQLANLAGKYDDTAAQEQQQLLSLYEQVFNHKEFTGRSGGMFGFEGLGCIYWHMVAKLLLAVEENFFTAVEQGESSETCQQLGQLYYRVRAGIGFNKTPENYGAFPTDPYSHTPKHAGAQQPGMTGQVKEEILSRFGELGLRVNDGQVSFIPNLLRQREFLSQANSLRYLDVDDNWQELTVPVAGLAFTWCQVPIVYQLNNDIESSLTIHWQDGQQQTLRDTALSADFSSELFKRNGKIRQISLTFATDQLFKE